MLPRLPLATALPGIIIVMDDYLSSVSDSSDLEEL